MKIKIGNYVRCPLDIENAPHFRDFLIGQITSIDEFENKATVKFHDIEDTLQYFDFIKPRKEYDLEHLERAKIINGSLSICKEEFVGKVYYCEEEQGYSYYYVIKRRDNKRIERISEQDIRVQFDTGEVSPLNQIKRFEMHNPVWYRGRVNMSRMNIAIENAPIGIDLLLGSRVFLFSHQIETIMRGLSNNPCRIMLADEVGLGKTIEACIIYKGLKTAKKKLKTIIIVPESLVNQWKNELSYKFWEEVEIWNRDMGCYQKDVIVALENIEEFTFHNNFNHYDLMIIDETHRLLKNKKQYEYIYNYSEKVEHIMLLSATPIQQRQLEYLELLRLLDPEKYKNMSIAEFGKLLKKNKRVKDDLYELTRDLIHYEEDEAGDYYIEDFTAMNKYLKDSILEKLIQDIKLDSDDKGLEVVRIILAYISNTYEIEKNIIRNRRVEIKDEFSKRSKEIYKYEMAGSLEGFYEKETYDALVEYLEYGKENKTINTSQIKELYGRILSSPWALSEGLKEDLSLPQGEALEKLKSFNQMWLKANKEELNNMDAYAADPESMHGRLMLALDILDEEYYDQKVVVFTNWTETAKIFHEYLSKKVGKEKTTLFIKGMSGEELEKNVNRFQEIEECRYLVCDITGGEGRNLQMADAILHIDMPWNPIDLEQRIGRLDRIGRDITTDVISIIMMSNDTIELDLFEIWDEGLDVFNESLSGIEIALNDIEKELESALEFDVSYGLKNSLENIKGNILAMKEEVDRERYYDYAKNIDETSKLKIKSLIEKFEGNNSKVLMHTMLTWFELVGFPPEIIKQEEGGAGESIIRYCPKKVQLGSIKKALFPPPNTQKALKRARRKNEIKGTFSKDLAINMEDLILFSPGDEIYDDINEHAVKSSKGRSNGFIIQSDVNWVGIVYRWNIKLNEAHFLKIGVNPKNIDFNYAGYLPINQVETYHRITVDSEKLSQVQVKERLDEWLQLEVDSQEALHLGRRGRGGGGIAAMEGWKDSNLEWIKSLYGDRWEGVIDKTYKVSMKKVIKDSKELIEMTKLREDLKNMVVSEQARNVYYGNGYKEIDLEKMYIEAIIEGLEDPVLELDSVAHIWLVKE